MDALFPALWISLLVGVAIAPPVLLFMGWRDLTARRFERADTRATLAAMVSLAQALLVGGISLLAVLIQERTPLVMAAVSDPAAFWVVSRRLHGSIHACRDAERREAREARSREEKYRTRPE